VVDKASTFSTILAKGVNSGQLPAKSQEARKWFRQEAKKITVPPSSLLREDQDRLKFNIKIGEMAMFFYDPKLKEELPYYDMFPLIFKISEDGSSFLGINFHYIPPVLRAKLMDALYTIASNKKYDEKTKLRISYQILNSASKFKYFKPCIKRYLRTHMRSKFMKVNANEWDIALWLNNTEQFKKATKYKVWQESRKIISGK